MGLFVSFPADYTPHKVEDLLESRYVRTYLLESPDARAYLLPEVTTLDRVPSQVQ